MEIKFDTSDLFTIGENYWGKTLSGEFKVITFENPLYQNKRLKIKGISVPNTNLQLNPYLNT